jgi:hypothetical protein
MSVDCIVQGNATISGMYRCLLCVSYNLQNLVCILVCVILKVLKILNVFCSISNIHAHVYKRRCLVLNNINDKTSFIGRKIALLKF